MILVLCEKKIIAEAVAEALPDGEMSVENGTIVKGKYTLIWTGGHLLTLKDPEDYDKKYKKWELSDLPIYFENWENKIGEGNARRVKQIGSLLKKADSVIHAGDTDEEGQLLIDEILRWFHYRGSVMRLDTADTSHVSIMKKLGQMSDNRAKEKDGWSAYARGVADKVFGYNLSRYYTLKNNNKGVLSVGRVQTATLGMVVNRDEMIENHKKISFYELFCRVEINGGQIEAKYIPNPENENLENGKFLNADCLQEKAVGIVGSYDSIVIKKSRSKQNPPLPFNYTELNAYCGKKFGYKPNQVMEITQSLRDDFNAITYNRTDCQYLTEEHFKEAPGVIASAVSNLSIDGSRFDATIHGKCFDDEKVSAHFAMIPTAERVDLSALSKEQKNVYKAIADYYLTQFLPAAVVEKTELVISFTGGEKISATAKRTLSKGYLEFLSHGEDNEEIEGNALGDLAAGIYSGSVGETKIVRKETKPPVRYTQSTLLKDMTRVSKYVKDPEMKKILIAKDKGKEGENGSIGTSATRGMIISGLIKRGYLKEEKHKKVDILISTPKGRGFYHMLPDNIKTADVTARWWLVQEEIKSGVSPEALPDAVLKTVREVISSG